MMMRRLAVTAAILFCFAIAYAQSPGKRASISGVVQDPAGASIAGAQVQLIMAHSAQQPLLSERLLNEVSLRSRGLTTYTQVRVAGHV